MPVNVIGTLKPKNNGKFPVAEAVDIKVTDDLRLDEALENKADLSSVNFALDNKADKTTTTSLQNQINNIIEPVTEEAEVINAREGADGTSYTTLKERCDSEYNVQTSRYNKLSDFNKKVAKDFGYYTDIELSYTSNEVPCPDGTFFEDTSATQSWFGSGFVEIPEGTKSIYYCGKSFKSDQVTITPIAIYDAEYNVLAYAPATAYITVYGVIDIPPNAKYFYQTKYYETVDTSKNSNNYTKIYYGEKYDLNYISQSAKSTGVEAVTYTSEDYTSTVIYKTNGATTAVPNWYSTDFVDCSGRATVTYDSYAYHDNTTDIAYVAFFNENKVMVSCLKSSDTTNGEKVGTTAVPEGAKYVRSLMAGGITPKLQLNATGIYAEYNFDDIAATKSEVGADAVSYTAEDYTSSAIYLTNGTSRTFADWYSTEFIDCSNAETIDYDSYAFYQNGIDVAYVAFFDENKVMVSCLKSSETTEGEKVGTVSVPSGAKYVRSIYAAATSMTPKLQINATGMKKDIYDLQNADRIITPLTYQSKICCIGDSLTEGIDYGSHKIKESYPYFMSKYLGCTILNYGQRGRTAKTWWDNYKDYYNYDPSIDVVLIMFGTNGGFTTNTLDTDVEPYDNPDDYADTSVGCCCKLIEKIMADTQNHAQIFMLTPPYSTYTTAQEQTVINSEPTIRAIAKRYQLPVIDVLNECGMGKFNGDVFRPHDGCHFNAKGYHRLGTFLGSKIMSMISKFELTDVYDDEYVDE